MIPKLMLGIAFTLVSIPKTVYSELPQRGVCAHRGASKTHPENTLPALREAVRLGASMIEFDVQLTRDGTLVLMHDTTVDRTTNGHGKVSELDWKELRKLDAGSWKGKAFEGVTIPNFEEALAVLPRDVWLNCHLKGGADVGKKAAETLAKTNRLHQAFLAAESEAARGAKEAVPNVMICNMDRHRIRLLMLRLRWPWERPSFNCEAKARYLAMLFEFCKVRTFESITITMNHPKDCVAYGMLGSIFHSSMIWNQL